MGEWQDIATAPKDGTHVLIWDSFSVFEGFNNRSFHDGEYHDSWQNMLLQPRPWSSHWQPLPAPPQTETGKGRL